MLSRFKPNNFSWFLADFIMENVELCSVKDILLYPMKYDETLNETYRFYFSFENTV